MQDTMMRCALCAAEGGHFLWHNDLCRVVLVSDDDYPGFCRVILNRHLSEMSDLPANEQQALMRVVFAVESAVRETVRPDKINLASLGNQTPHIHWHVIPRWHDDCAFPDPIWAPARRHSPHDRRAPEVALLRRALITRLGPSVARTAEQRS